VRATAAQLRRLVSAMVKAGGSADGEADLVAEHLVAANLAGHDSHGVGMMPSYVRHLKAGLLIPNTKAKVVKDDGPALMFDGGRGYGRSVAGESIAAGIARCRQLGVAVVTLAASACTASSRKRPGWSRSISSTSPITARWSRPSAAPMRGS
jgi:uncharacterized oxidoreductase